jgi:hypothetical protein
LKWRRGVARLVSASMRRPIGARILVMGLVAASCCVQASALAEEEPVKGSGVIGGALLGAEVVVVSEALAGVEPGWVYWLSAFASAAVGGYVGSRIEASTKPEVSTGLLGAGLVLAVPSVVWIGNSRDADTTRPRAARVRPAPTARIAESEWHGEARGEGAVPRLTVRVPLLSGCF